MKIKVVNRDYELFNQEYKVVNMNYDMVIVNKEGDKISLKMDDVEVIPENDYENIVSKCRDILKIRLDKGISMALYTALFQCIKERINGEIKSIDVFRDDYKISRRGIWEKRLMVVVNDSTPLEIIAVAGKFEKKFNITIKDMSLNCFINTCSEDIMTIRREICQREALIDIYKNALKKVLDNAVGLNEGETKFLCRAEEE